MKKAMEHLTQGKANAEKTMGDFKKFIMRGNVVDMAVGVIIGGAFGKIVTSLVNDVLMPPIGLLLGNVSFSDLFIQLKGPHFATLAEAQKAGVATLNYGLFLNTIINFLIVSFSIFLLIQQMARFQKPAPAAAPTTKECPHCCSNIALKATRCSFCTSSLAG